MVFKCAVAFKIDDEILMSGYETWYVCVRTLLVVYEKSKPPAIFKMYNKKG